MARKGYSIKIDTKQAEQMFAKQPEIFTKKLLLGLQKSGRLVETAVKDDMTKSGPWRIIPRQVAKGKIRGPIVTDSVDTGILRASVSHKVKGLTAEIFSNLEYAHAIEFGSQGTGTKPRRHFRTALAKQKENVINIIKNSLKN